MSEFNQLKEILPKVIVGSVKYPNYDSIPDSHPTKSIESLLPIVKRSIDAGSEGCLFYLYNNDMVQFLNTIYSENKEIKIMLIINFMEMDVKISLLSRLDFKPEIVFLDFSISDQRDNDLVNKYYNAISKYCNNIGLFSKEPIGTVSFFITSNPKINIFLIPFNMLGFAIQNRSLIEMIVNSSENIYISTDPLAERRIKPRQAFDYITTHKIHGAVIDVEEMESLLEAIKYAKYFFETHDFLPISLEFEDHSEICENCGLGMSRYYPPTGGSWWYCPHCQDKKENP